MSPHDYSVPRSRNKAFGKDQRVHIDGTINLAMYTHNVHTQGHRHRCSWGAYGQGFTTIFKLN